MGEGEGVVTGDVGVGVPVARLAKDSSRVVLVLV